MNIIGVPHVISLILKPDNIEWLDRCAQKLSKQRNHEVSRSEAANYIFERHKIKIIKATADRNHDAKVAQARLSRR